MKWTLEVFGVRQEREFDSPTEAAKWAAMMWPDIPETTIADNDADDRPGWLVVPVKPERL